MTEPAERSERGDNAHDERPRPTPTIELTATEIPGQEKAAKAGEQMAGTAAGAAGGAKASAAETPTGRARAASSSAPPRAKPRNRAWPIVTAGIAGVCIVIVAGALWLSRANQQNDRTAALASHLARVQAELGTLAARPQFSAQDAQRTDDLAARLAAAEEKLQALADDAKRTASSAQPQQQEASTSRLAALEQTLAPSGDFAARVGRLEAAVADAPTDPASAERLRATEKNLQSLDARTNEFARRLAAIEARLSDTATRAKVNEERSVENQASAGIDEAARFAVLADALAVKVDRGQAFAAEFLAIKPFVAQQSVLEPLAPMAQTGVPSAATLSRELVALVPAIAAAIGPRDDSLIDRLQATAERLVRVRPINAEAGDDPRNVLARIEAKARQNDIDGALAELSRLPEQARAPAMEWIRKAEARRAAIDASRRISTASMNALGKPASQ